MSDLIAIQIGAAPWCPAANAEAVREYHYHDFPLTGVLRQQNVEYLFFCLTGQDEPYNYWAYIRVAPETRAYLEAATSSTDFDERFEALNFNGPAVLAFAGDAYGILGFAELDMSDPESLHVATEVIAGQLDTMLAAERRLVPA